jgi:hypothetical protein
MCISLPFSVSIVPPILPIRFRVAAIIIGLPPSPGELDVCWSVTVVDAVAHMSAAVSKSAASVDTAAVVAVPTTCVSTAVYEVAAVVIAAAVSIAVYVVWLCHPDTVVVVIVGRYRARTANVANVVETVSLPGCVVVAVLLLLLVILLLILLLVVLLLLLPAAGLPGVLYGYVICTVLLSRCQQCGAT